MKDPDTKYGLEGDEISIGAHVEICPGYDLTLLPYIILSIQHWRLPP